VKKMLDYLMHIFELMTELRRPGEIKEWHRVSPREEARLMRPRIPKDSSCYPYHADLDRSQLVHPEDFGHPSH
jgi:hypothetical protein